MTAAQHASRAVTPRPVQYPSSDGKPMAENTLQFRWIVVLKENLDAAIPDFVAGDLLWYPVEGDNKIRQAPDVMVALGRPKCDRSSYRQWEEENRPLHVVFEVLSPGNRIGEMYKKLRFYERYGVEEYYVIDPENQSLLVMLRQGDQLIDVPEVDGFVSPLLGVRFAHEGEELVVYRPDGIRFQSFKELMDRAESETRRADGEAKRAEAEARRADEATARAEALAERLRALGIDTGM